MRFWAIGSKAIARKGRDEGQTFKKMVNQKVLPETFSVIFDPTVRRKGESMDLVGAYRYDNEGVKARRVPVIEKGVLKNFLMSRTPVEGFLPLQWARSKTVGPGGGGAPVEPFRRGRPGPTPAKSSRPC